LIKILLIDLGSSRCELNEPIGICAVGSYLNQKFLGDVSVEFIFKQLSDVPSLTRLSTYDIIGISTKIGSLNRLKELMGCVGRIPTDVRPAIIFGDLIATFAPEELLQMYPDAFCAVGEGEQCFSEFVSAFSIAQSQGTSLFEEVRRRNVPNLAFRHADSFVQHASRLIDLADCPPPDRSFAKQIALKGGIVRAEASRGCAWGKCSFCAIQHKYCGEVHWRKIDIERILGELELLSQKGIRSPFFTDEDFVGDNPNRAIELGNAIREAKLRGRIASDMSLYVDMRVDSILSRGRNGGPTGSDVLDALKSAGLREVFIGLESGAKEQVRRFKKASTAAKNAQVLEMLQQKGISVDIGFIMFDPEMSVPELIANIDFLHATGLSRHDARMTKCLRIEPGTPVLGEYERKDLITGPLDIDELIYPFKWRDPVVEEVYAQFSIWEQRLMPEVYAIQAATRGEVASEAWRAEIRSGLGQIRFIEISALEHLAKDALEPQRFFDPGKLRQLQDDRKDAVDKLLSVVQ